jgi:hypothetical protein
LAYKLNSSILAALFLALPFAGCDESLPPRNQPLNFLEASLAPPHPVVEIENGQPIKDAGSFIATLKNSYDDVLQKKADIRATVEVWMEDNEFRRRTFRLPPGSLSSPAPQGETLTLLPGQSARFVALWDQRTDRGEPFWSFVGLTTKVSPDGDVYQDSDPVRLVAQVSIQLFENVQPRVSPPIHFTVIFRIFGGSGGGN